MYSLLGALALALNGISLVIAAAALDAAVGEGRRTPWSGDDLRPDQSIW